MAVKFQSICKIVGNREQVIMPNPNKILVNFLTVTPPKKLSSDYLYAIKASRLRAYKHLENLSLLIYEDIPLPQEYYQIDGLNLIITKDTESFQKLKIEFQEIFDEQVRINNYAYQLMQLCHESANKQQLLDTAYSMIKNPILLLDTNLVLNACSGVYAGISDPVINYCLEHNHMPNTFLQEMVSESAPRTDETWPSLLCLEHGTHEFVSTSIIAGRVKRGKQFLGYIKVFEYNHPVTDLEKRCLLILCDFMSIALTDTLPYLPVANIRIEDFLSDLLGRHITSKEAIENRVFLYHLDNTQKHYVISVKYNSQTVNTDQLYHLKRRLMNILHIPTITFFDQMIVMIVPSLAWKEHRTELTGFLNTHGLLAGISLSFTSYVDVPKYYSQTLACLEIHNRFALTDTLIDYNDWKTTHIFLHLQECCDLEDLIPNSIRILKEHDQTRGTNLVETLFAFVHHRQNITETAAELHLHYNTMKYRINQITDLTDIDFDSFDYMFNIIIAEKVFDIMTKDITLKNRSPLS